MSKFSFWLLLVLFLGCSKADSPDPAPPPPPPPGDSTAWNKQQFDILALGDSYTKGEGVSRSQSFPFQLADSLAKRGYTLLQPTPLVVAQTGWRTDNLLTAWNAQPAGIRDSIFSLVTLLIGVNNQFQNTDFSLYPPQFQQLLEIALARAGGDARRVVVISIPDYAFTPAGQSFGSPLITSQEIDEYNNINKAKAEQYGVAYVYVTGISRQGLAQPDWVAADGLHPSGKQYTEWVKLILNILPN